jgi:hypothetical protein
MRRLLLVELHDARIGQLAEGRCSDGGAGGAAGLPLLVGDDPTPEVLRLVRERAGVCFTRQCGRLA